ncbi:hypothetical protein [Halolamina salifodinae]|uniref:Putative peptidase inhibitor domain-containing protein n=1 Tax=Halolamina salifodinae TaxID=1202767 RepID=A0A8T4GWI1_9EURY|nr:hypothetical protein [Halolamina salifodinae]MBP1987481.1 hypothetical protein [Halolamina salifodinae]
MYLSHPVRRMRRDPGPETAGLVVELDPDADPAALQEAVDDAGGEVAAELQFDCWLIRVPEAALDDLCSLPGVVRIETEATLDRSVDETLGDIDDEGDATPNGGN